MEILHTTRITQEKWVNLFRRTYRHNGHEGQWVFASRHADPPVPPRNVNAVIIVPILVHPTEPPRLVVTREFRVPLGTYEYSFPAGLIEQGESLEEATRRELREETGLEVLTIQKISPPTYSSAGLTDESAVFVFVTAHAPEGARQTLDSSEDIEVLLLDHQQVCDLCNAKAPVNGRAWAVLFLFQQLGRLRLA